jgi:ATP-dependent DNA ligase
MVRVPALPSDLTGPVAVELARLEERLPGTVALPGGSRYEPKWDGYRLVVVRDETGARLWSRNGSDLTDRFPDIAAATSAQLSPGTVLDGEVVIWDGARLSFDLLQARMATTARRVAGLARQHPASYVAFDVLAHDGVDLRRRTWSARRQCLEALSVTWTPPLQLSPVTADPEQARRWMRDLRPAGIEGLVVKGARTRYAPGRRDWVKVKERETREVIVGGVIGRLHRPEALVAGLYAGLELVIVGRSTALSDVQSRSLGGLLRPPSGPHPWPDQLSPGHFGGGRRKIPLTKAEPRVVAEVTVDTALRGGKFRHPLRYIRLRADLEPDDLPILPARV